MDVYENIQAGDVINPVGEAILSLVAAIRTGNDILKNAILDGLSRNGVDSYSAMAMAKFVMDDGKKESEADGTNNPE